MYLKIPGHDTPFCTFPIPSIYFQELQYTQIYRSTIQDSKTETWREMVSCEDAVAVLTRLVFRKTIYRIRNIRRLLIGFATMLVGAIWMSGGVEGTRLPMYGGSGERSYYYYF
ncbi:hypothetical protein ZOSMA_147G00280 [Zostera marina]|uniref:Uncharacterized protein n=1 Tax=Zostera marina TaxID=29655 RepID=A0A0K9PWY4_ZOSMR|nr:hypothetical protein ZOSMA_147G00280 [Zostera marina]